MLLLSLRPSVRFYPFSSGVVRSLTHVDVATAVHLACETSNAETVDYLLEHGGDKLLTFLDEHHYTPLISAAAKALPRHGQYAQDASADLRLIGTQRYCHAARGEVEMRCQ